MRQLTDYEIKQYQIKILNEVDKFCRENKINYYLEGGTLLGAIRHNGFIPWDDDIDLMMFRDEYDKFIKLFNEKHTDFHAYSIDSDKGYNLHFCKISYEKTLLEETNLVPNKIPLGVNIDLFPVDLFPKECSGKQILKTLHNIDKLMYSKSHRFSTLKYKPIRQQILIMCYKLLGLLVSKRFLGEQQQRIAKQFSNVDTKFCSEITCHFKNSLPHWKIKDFEPIEHIFEGKMYQVPKGYDDILTQQYGDYMKLPPEKDRVALHGFKAWEVNK